MTPSRILLVDENPDTARFLQSCLIRAGYSVPLVASNGREAADMGAACNPDLAFVSTTLPGQPDAFDTARGLRRSLRIPVLFLAPPEGGDFSLNRAQAPLGTGYLLRPFTENEVLAAAAQALGEACSQSSQERQRRTLEQTLAALQDGVIATDFAGLISYLNSRAATLLQLSPADAIGQPLPAVLEAAKCPAPQASIPLEQADGSLAGCLHVFRDSAVAPGAGGVPVADLADRIPAPLLVLDAGEQVARLNASAATLLGAAAEEIVGKSLWNHLPPSAHEQHGAGLKRAFEQQSPHAFRLHLDRDNSWWQARAFPLDGQQLLLLQDITQEMQAAQEAERVSRLEGLSHLARGFTHDFNNLLTILMGNLALARAQTGPGELQRLLDESESATRRARDLVEQLTTFAKGGAPIRGMIPLRPILTEVLGRRPASARIAYQTQFEGPEFTLDADPKQLRRLLENLILNAEQAIRGQGEIRIRCYRPEDAAQSAAGASFLIIEIQDTGCGMSEETRTRAFDPFFTTRAQVNATGLGLTVCESIAKAHGGSIRLRSQPGKGTVAEVRLPLHIPDSRSAVGPVRLSRPLNGRRVSLPESTASRRRILILEDETLIRKLMHSTLCQAGFQVDETWDGAQTVEAFRAARDKGQPYDLLIMDLAIENGMGGVEAMSRIRSLDPSVLAIVSSGYSDAPAMAQPQDYGFSSVLPKPYEMRNLVEAVLQTLAKRHHAHAEAAG